MGIGEPKFNPNNSEYKKVSDLPAEEQKNFKNVEGGFITKKAEVSQLMNQWDADAHNFERNPINKIFGQGKLSDVDMAHQEAKDMSENPMLIKYTDVKEAAESVMHKPCMHY